MTESDEINQEYVLDRDTLELLGSAPARAEFPAQRLAKLRDSVLRRVDEEQACSTPYVTIRGDEGDWNDLVPLAAKKILNVNRETGIESYLLRLLPGATLEQHRHDEDELCIVLEGDVSFDDIHLKAGDYHYARKGSWHGRAISVHGALLFLQSGVATASATA